MSSGSGGPSKAIIGITVGVIGIAAGVSAFLLLNHANGTTTDQPIVVAPPPVKTPTPTLPAQVVDAGGEVAAVKPQALEDAGAVAVAPNPNPTPTATPTPTPTPDPTPTKNNPPAKAHAAHGEVEVRVRPFAMLYVDGQQIGQTPLDKPLSLTTGKHSFRMVNEQYQKDVAVDFTVKPGKSVFKYNLME